MRFEDLADFVARYTPYDWHQRKPIRDEKKNPESRWRKFTYDEVIALDKTTLDIYWLKDKRLTGLDNLPEPDVFAEEITENLEGGLDRFRHALAGCSGHSG